MKTREGTKDRPGPGLAQAYLRVDCGGGEAGGRAPSVVLLDESEASHAADLVKLDGIAVDAPAGPVGGGKWHEPDAWDVCSKIADACRYAEKARSEMSARNAYCEHLAYAYSILCDYAAELDGDCMMSKETAETLVRGAIDRIVRAGKCFGFRLDQYRIDD